MTALLRFAHIVDAVNERVGRWSAWLGLAAVLICTVNAIMRYAFNVSSNAWLEMQWYLNAAVFLLVAGYTLKRYNAVQPDSTDH